MDTHRVGAFVLGVGLLVACGGIANNDDGGTNNDGGGNNDGGAIDSGSSPCPLSTPADNAACSVENLDCQYGGDPNIQCDTVAHCGGGAWHVTKPWNSMDCPTPKNPAVCPPSFASVPQGQLCSEAYPATCHYPEGWCGCAVPDFGPFPADAASVAKWSCDSPGQGCPMPAPQLGTACAQDGLSCMYSVCSLPSAEGVVCSGGYWQQQMVACAQ